MNENLRVNVVISTYIYKISISNYHVLETNYVEVDLAQAYLQLPLDEASRKYVTINTQKGL